MQLSVLTCDQELELRKVDPKKREGERRKTGDPGSRRFYGKSSEAGKAQGRPLLGVLTCGSTLPPQTASFHVSEVRLQVSKHTHPTNRRLDCSWLQGSPVDASGVVQTLTVKMRRGGPLSSPRDPPVPVPALSRPEQHKPPGRGLGVCC